MWRQRTSSLPGHRVSIPVGPDGAAIVTGAHCAARILEITEANARQLASRAWKHLAAKRRNPATAGEQRRLLDLFLAAAQAGDLAALEKLFSADVISYSVTLASIARVAHTAHQPSS